jgi:putative membrane protein
MTAPRKTQSRKPAAFSLEDPHVVVALGQAARDQGAVVVTPEPEIEQASPPLHEPPRKRRALRWGAMFWLALLGLLVLGAGLSLVDLVEALFARSYGFGYLAVALAGTASVALSVGVVREAIGLARLAAMDDLRARASAVIESDDRAAGRTIVGEVIALTRRMPHLARARTRLQAHLGEIIDGRDLVQLAERELMATLDGEARRLVGNAAKRVSVVTAVSPRAAVDILFVFGTAVALMRRLALLYGARPGLLGLIRLVRHVVAHLAFTGGLAVSDGLVQQLVGHGLAAKLSARLGEGVLNGLLTARLGIAAIEVTRTLPFSVLPRPSLNDLVGKLLRPGDGGGAG